MGRPGHLFCGRLCLDHRAGGPGGRPLWERRGGGRLACRPPPTDAGQPARRRARRPARPEDHTRRERPRPGGPGPRARLCQGPGRRLHSGVSDGRGQYVLQPHDSCRLPERRRRGGPDQGKRPDQRHGQLLLRGRTGPGRPGGVERRPGGRPCPGRGNLPGLCCISLPNTAPASGPRWRHRFCRRAAGRSVVPSRRSGPTGDRHRRVSDYPGGQLDASGGSVPGQGYLRRR